MSEERKYRIELTRQAEKELRQLRAGRELALRTILTLEVASETRGHALSGNLQGLRALEWRVQGVEYRAAYTILPDVLVCVVFMVGPHQNFYRDAGRRRDALEKAIAAGAFVEVESFDEDPAPDEESASGWDLVPDVPFLLLHYPHELFSSQAK